MGVALPTIQSAPITSPARAPQGGPSLLGPAPANSDVNQWILDEALALMGQIRHLPADEAYMRHMGVMPIFRSGMDAQRLIQGKGIKVVFGDMGESTAHAQWIAEQNTMMINQKYQGDTSFDTLLAISEAMYHEAGHAAGSGDNQSSIQEETNCLALNTLANRFHQWQFPQYAQACSPNSPNANPLIANGVALYSRFFFDPDPYKKALVSRIVEKYGDLPLTSPDHPVPMLPGNVPLAQRVLQQKPMRHQWVA